MLKKYLPIIGLIIVFIAMVIGFKSNDENVIADSTEIVEVTPTDESHETPLGQLSDIAQPKHYRIELTLIPESEGFSGVTEIDLTLKPDTKVFYIHGKGLNVTNAVLLQNDKVFSAIYEQVHSSGVVSITLPKKVSGDATLKITYDAQYSKSLDSIYKVNESGQSYIFSQMEAISARMAIPSFDEPLFKVPFDISVITEAKNTVISTTPEVSLNTLDDGTVKHTFATTKPLPIYLIAFAVGEFDVLEWSPIPANELRDFPIPLRGIAAKGKGDQLQFALENTRPILEALEEYFGIAYPYEKLDIIAAPDFAFGAMENVGAIVYRETLLLLDENAPLWQLRAYGAVHGHELGHQWFGNLVTPKWWDDIWLNEAFATWVSYKAAHVWRPDLEFDRNMTKAAHGAMAIDARSSARQIRNPITTNDDIMNAFDGITYRKGGGVLQMFESYVGEDNFRKGVQLHMKRHAHSTADIHDFLKSLADGSGHPEMIPAFESFLYQSGVPLVDIQQSCSNDEGQLTLTQQRYVPLGVQAADAQQWQIPFCYASDKDSTCELLTGPDETLTQSTCPQWMMPNRNAAGYYRWNLTDEGWNKLQSQINTLNAAELFSLADNLYASFKAGKVSAQTLLTTYEKLVLTPYWDVASLPAQHMRSLRRTVLNDEATSDYKARIESLYGPLFDQLGFDASTDADMQSPNSTALLRAAVIKALALDAKNPEIRQALKLKLTAYLGDLSSTQAFTLNKTAMSADIVGTALLVAVEDGDHAFIMALKDRAIESTDAVFRGDALYAISNIPSLELGDAIIDELLLSEQVRSNEAQALVNSFMANPVLQDATWSWLQSNLDDFLRRYSSFSIARVVSSTNTFCDANMRNDMVAFFTKNEAKISGAPRMVKETEEVINQCIALREAKSDEFKQALKAQ
ncbi:M1 family metallopeptidase [Echinimonas agarilytica]|uniref:Aminopeptidase n=1 Tax=Echinimonas agarilytica TaxID=1215918 RepID=A0AA41W841_9GAMM|nr:M1 family metallopeptidase [Echinimonas agarilytica]MCM2680039.1 M1 family metallopeptidase [Echinimonas agarilytica]